MHRICFLIIGFALLGLGWVQGAMPHWGRPTLRLQGIYQPQTLPTDTLRGAHASNRPAVARSLAPTAEATLRPILWQAAEPWQGQNLRGYLGLSTLKPEARAQLVLQPNPSLGTGQSRYALRQFFRWMGTPLRAAWYTASHPGHFKPAAGRVWLALGIRRQTHPLHPNLAAHTWVAPPPPQDDLEIRWGAHLAYRHGMLCWNENLQLGLQNVEIHHLVPIQRIAELSPNPLYRMQQPMLGTGPNRLREWFMLPATGWLSMALQNNPGLMLRYRF